MRCMSYGFLTVSVLTSKSRHLRFSPARVYYQLLLDMTLNSSSLCLSPARCLNIGNDNLSPVHTYWDIFESATFTFSSVDRQRIQFKFACPNASDGIRNHSSTQQSPLVPSLQSMRQRARDSGGKFIYFTVCLAPAFPNFPHFDIWFLVSVRDWTQFCYARGFENILTRPSTRYLIRCGCIFPLSLKQIPKMIRIRLMRVDGNRIRKENVAVSKLSGCCGRGLSFTWLLLISACRSTIAENLCRNQQ